MSVATELERALAPFAGGALPVRLTAWDGSVAGPRDAPRVTVSSPNALARLLWNPGELGAAQAYVSEEIDVDGDLGEALEHVWEVAAQRGLRGVRPGPKAILAAARVAIAAGVLGRRPSNPASQAKVRGRLHSLRRDRAVIGHHYDLSNDFYSLILDSRMAYSSAYFGIDPQVCAQVGDETALEAAQLAKLDLVCDKVGLRPGARFLDVGCGWGALAIHAAHTRGARVPGITLSREQKSFADKRIADLGLEERVEIRLQDYRETPERGFDAAASLEMGEHVGDANYPSYARMLHDAVRPGGKVLVQQMSRDGRHPGGGPFIESFIAPDMSMRPVARTVAALTATGLDFVESQSLRRDYVWTVDGWLANFRRNRREIEAMVGLEVARVWELYLVGGRMSFDSGRMGVDQILLRRPGGDA